MFDTTIALLCWNGCRLAPPLIDRGKVRSGLSDLATIRRLPGSYGLKIGGYRTSVERSQISPLAARYLDLGAHLCPSMTRSPCERHCGDSGPTESPLAIRILTDKHDQAWSKVLCSFPPASRDSIVCSVSCRSSSHICWRWHIWQRHLQNTLSIPGRRSIWTHAVFIHC